jgi:hypothetical protein
MHKEEIDQNEINDYKNVVYANMILAFRTLGLICLKKNLTIKEELQVNIFFKRRKTQIFS